MSEYEPTSTEELIAESEAILTDADSDFEPFEGSINQTLIRTNAELLAENQEQTLQRLYNASFVETATGEELEMKVREHGLSRKEAVPASGVLTFARASEPETNYVIPRGTRVSTPDGEIRAETTQKGQLLAIDGFESSSLSSVWNGDTAAVSIGNTTVDTGSGSLTLPSTSNVSIHRRDVTVGRGDTLRTSAYIPATGAVGVQFGVQDASNYYTTILDVNDGTLSLAKAVNGTESQLTATSTSVSGGSWVTLEIEWGLTHELTVEVVETTDTLSYTDATFTEGGVGVESRDGSVEKYVDDICTVATSLNAEAVNGGEDTNVGSGSFTTFVSAPTGVDAVVNPLTFGNSEYYDLSNRRFTVGSDREDDETLRERVFKSSAQGGAGTSRSIEAALRAVDSVIGVKAVNNRSSTSTDANGRPPLSVEFIVYGGSDAAIAEALHENVGVTENIVSGYGGTTESYTITDSLLNDDEVYTWSTPPIDDIDVTVDIVTDDTYAGDEAVKRTLVEYIGGTNVDGAIDNGVGIGDDVYHDAIIDRLVGDELGVVGVASITLDGSGDGTDDSTTNANGLQLYDVGPNDVAQTNATDGSITVNTT